MTYRRSRSRCWDKDNRLALDLARASGTVAPVAVAVERINCAAMARVSGIVTPLPCIAPNRSSVPRPLDRSASGDLRAERLRVRILDAPLDDSVPMSFGRLVRRQVCVVEIDARGLTGVGESWINYPAWASHERVATLREVWRPLLGQDVTDPECVQQTLARQLVPVGR